ncbi:MAG: SMC-Scp complex subunit ScpB [Bifidobacteriaceae bacterium]|nr:SMC-Scp complex subunit ScpB [Bifidobacteriaceae bacterium]
MEAILMATDEPLHAADFARVLGCPVEEASRLLDELAQEYDEQGRGFELRRTARGWQYASRGRFEQVVGRFVTDGQTAKLSQAALEALAIIAYKQPVTRAQVAAIRGVNSDGVIRSLSVRGLIRTMGEDEESHATLLGTSALFLDYMGVESLQQLPPLAPFLPSQSAANSDDAAQWEQRS